MKTRIKAVLFVVCICMIISSAVVLATPGDDSDPLITLSYITDVLMPDIESRISQSGGQGGGSDSFSLVNVEENYMIIGQEGTEFVVRSGTGRILATKQGGIADLTDGTDLMEGRAIPLNHHLLVPRADGRGMVFTSNGIVMVKGAYRIMRY